MTTISFIGLGTVGAPMARNLLRSGFDVVGYNRSPARIAEFVAAGGAVPDRLRRPWPTLMP
ncbi:NAD(P)-binding domain-containing protein [Streptomyces sp. NPDC001792]|uniref:NAD(P)-binding domain-containing protein n=1 Tax=Streptomyces sp. NPDC001792 TaxID=3154524 RepID=UPI003330C3A8